MQYKEIEAQTVEEARIKIKKEFGDRARIIRTSEVSEGGFLGFGKKKSVKVLVSISEDDLLRRYKENMGITSQAPKKDAPLPPEKKRVEELKKTVSNLTAGAGGGGADHYSISVMMEKLNAIERMVQSGEIAKRDSLHRNIAEVKDILKENEFFDDFIDSLITEMENTLPLSKIDDRYEVHSFVYNYLKEKIEGLTDRKVRYKENEKSVFVLVGPTGVGKTTTIAKIAANAIKEKKKVELITIDGYRIGAKYQLEKYAELMNARMNSIEDNLELQRIIALSDAELILIDTIGRSQSDEIHLVKMKKMLELKADSIEYVLAVSATTKPKELERIFKNFEMFDYQNVIITKSDESETVGAIVNMMIKKGKGIIYYTDGQRVPNDIEKANVFNILSRIKGLDPNVYLMNARY